MSESKQLPKELPSMEKVIDLSVQGKITGRSYAGSFSFKIPSGKLKAKADIKRAQLNGGVKEEFLDPTVAEFHYWIAYLFYSIQESPKWWKDSEYGYDLHDVNVVQTLFEECAKFEAEWMREVWGESDGGSGKEPS